MPDSTTVLTCVRTIVLRLSSVACSVTPQRLGVQVYAFASQLVVTASPAVGAVSALDAPLARHFSFSYNTSADTGPVTLSIDSLGVSFSLNVAGESFDLLARANAWM